MAEQNQGKVQDELNHVLPGPPGQAGGAAGGGEGSVCDYQIQCDGPQQRCEGELEELEGKEVSVAGRMMFKRVMGKASFCNIQDLKGRIQVYVARDSVGEEPYKDFKKMDIGDILGVRGNGVQDQDRRDLHPRRGGHPAVQEPAGAPGEIPRTDGHGHRYRQRYVDLIMNEDVKETFIKRSQILAAIRRYLAGEGFMEVETPMLVANAGGAAARPLRPISTPWTRI